MKILVVGDPVGQLFPLHELAEKREAEAIIVVGDGEYTVNGYSVHRPKAPKRRDFADYVEVKLDLFEKIPLHVIVGNHDAYDLWAKVIDKELTLPQGIHFHDNGSTFTLDDVTFGVLGGVHANNKYENPLRLVTGNKARFYHFRKEQVDALRESQSQVIISHSGPRHSRFLPGGNRPLRELIDGLDSVKYLFHGHENKAYFDNLHGTRIRGLTDFDIEDPNSYALLDTSKLKQQ